MTNDRFTGQAIAENRRYPRKKMKLLVHYHCVNDDATCAVETLSDNIGFGGLALWGEEKMSVGQLLMMTIYIPPEKNTTNQEQLEMITDDTCTPINVLSRVAWCRDENKQAVTMGAQFLHLIVDDRKKMEAFAENFNLLNNEQRSFN